MLETEATLLRSILPFTKSTRWVPWVDRSQPQVDSTTFHRHSQYKSRVLWNRRQFKEEEVREREREREKERLGFCSYLNFILNSICNAYRVNTTLEITSKFIYFRVWLNNVVKSTCSCGRVSRLPAEVESANSGIDWWQYKLRVTTVIRTWLVLSGKPIAHV